MAAVAEDVVRIPPRYFNLPLKQAALLELKRKYEGRVDTEHRVVIVAVTDILEIEELGRIVPGDPGTWHNVVFEMLLFRPEQNEVVEGEVVDILEHGIFVNLGPLDGYIHVSQVSPLGTRVEVNPVQGVVVDRQANVVIKKGDRVRAKVQAVSFRVRTGAMPRVSLTMRGGEFLGKLEWIEEKVKKLLESRAKTTG